jgi:hypothetical protein
MRARTTFLVAAAAGLGALVAVAAVLVAKPFDRATAVPTPHKAVWSETPWPFLMDQWGKGVAYRCKAADCGTEVGVYVRAKIGFCNCTTGVSDDDELDRVGDAQLIGAEYLPVEPGREITVAWMKGRSRPYLVKRTAQADQPFLALAFNDRCDVIVVTVIAAHDQPTALEPAVLTFLNSRTVLRWAEVTLGL